MSCYGNCNIEMVHGNCRHRYRENENKQEHSGKYPGTVIHDTHNREVVRRAIIYGLPLSQTPRYATSAYTVVNAGKGSDPTGAKTLALMTPFSHALTLALPTRYPLLFTSIRTRRPARSFCRSGSRALPCRVLSPGNRHGPAM